MSDGQERLANLLGWTAMGLWGDMPRNVQEALFETAMKGHSTEREKLARLLTTATLEPCTRRGRPERSGQGGTGFRGRSLRSRQIGS